MNKLAWTDTTDLKRSSTWAQCRCYASACLRIPQHNCRQCALAKGMLKRPFRQWATGLNVIWLSFKYLLTYLVRKWKVVEFSKVFMMIMLVCKGIVILSIMRRPIQTKSPPIFSLRILLSRRSHYEANHYLVKSYGIAERDCYNERSNLSLTPWE